MRNLLPRPRTTRRYATVAADPDGFTVRCPRCTITTPTGGRTPFTAGFGSTLPELAAARIVARLHNDGHHAPTICRVCIPAIETGVHPRFDCPLGPLPRHIPTPPPTGHA